MSAHGLASRLASVPPAVFEGRAASQRERFAQERQLQMQRFDLDQQQLLQSTQLQRLQPTPAGGQLSFP
jgi:hypothetical protein